MASPPVYEAPNILTFTMSSHNKPIFTDERKPSTYALISIANLSYPASNESLLSTDPLEFHAIT